MFLSLTILILETCGHDPYVHGRNQDALRLPLTWNTTNQPPAPGTLVQLRLFFRDATIYAVGSDDEAAALMQLQI